MIMCYATTAGGDGGDDDDGSKVSWCLVPTLLWVNVKENTNPALLEDIY